MSQVEREFNGEFKEIKRWPLTPKTDLVMSVISYADSNEKRIFFNKQWTKKDGNTGRGQGISFPPALAKEVGDLIISTSSTL